VPRGRVQQVRGQVAQCVATNHIIVPHRNDRDSAIQHEKVHPTTATDITHFPLVMKMMLKPRFPSHCTGCSWFWRSGPSATPPRPPLGQMVAGTRQHALQGLSHHSGKRVCCTTMELGHLAQTSPPPQIATIHYSTHPPCDYRTTKHTTPALTGDRPPAVAPTSATL
jgi:hypothetical protein